MAGHRTISPTTTNDRRSSPIAALIVASLAVAIGGGCNEAPTSTTTPTSSSALPRAASPSTIVAADAPAADAILAGRARAQATFAAGDLDGALAEFDRLVRDADAAGHVDLAVIRCDRAVVLSQRAAKSTDLRSRERELRAAVADCATEPVLKQNLADTLLRRARDADNVGFKHALLRESIALTPLVPALVDLALLLEGEDDLAGAVAAVDQAIEIGEREQRGDPRIVALRERLQKSLGVEGGFQSARHSHFVARFEGYAENQLAWTALDTLEQARFTVGKALDLYPTSTTTVVIYTGDQYKSATAGPDWSTGLFDGKIRIREGQLAADKGTLADTLVHEYVHAALHTLPSTVPTWFHEGLAQHFERHRPPPVALLERTGVAPRAVLDRAFVGLPADVVPAAYATSHALVQRMVERRGVWGLSQLIAELKGGRSFDDAFQRSFAVDVDTVYADLVR